MMAAAFDLSEELELPVLMRTVTRLAHSRAAVVASGQMRSQNKLEPETETANWNLLPINARRRYQVLISKQPEIAARAESSPFNSLELGPEGGLGVIV